MVDDQCPYNQSETFGRCQDKEANLPVSSFFPCVITLLLLTLIDSSSCFSPKWLRLQLVGWTMGWVCDSGGHRSGCVIRPSQTVWSLLQSSVALDKPERGKKRRKNMDKTQIIRSFYRGQTGSSVQTLRPNKMTKEGRTRHLDCGCGEYEPGSVFVQVWPDLILFLRKHLL